METTKQLRPWRVQVRTPKTLESLQVTAATPRDALAAALAGEEVRRIVEPLKPGTRCSATCDGMTTTFFPDEVGDRLAEVVGAGKDQKDEPFHPEVVAITDDLQKALGDAVAARAIEEAARKMYEESLKAITRAASREALLPQDAGGSLDDRYHEKAARLLGLNSSKQVLRVDRDGLNKSSVTYKDNHSGMIWAVTMDSPPERWPSTPTRHAKESMEALKKAIDAAPVSGPPTRYRPSLSRMCRVAQCSVSDVLEVNRNDFVGGWELRLADGRRHIVSDLALEAYRG